MHDIRPFIPQLFTNPGTLLYIGARVDAHSWLDELIEAGHEITILEVWPDNLYKLVDEVGHLFHHGYIGDIRDIESMQMKDISDKSYFQYDYIFYWHGPEHLALPEIAPTLQKLESKCNRLIALACPYGLYPQDAHAGNPFEVHQSTLYPEFFKELGYEVKTDGLPNEAGSEMVAWKVMDEK